MSLFPQPPPSLPNGLTNKVTTRWRLCMGSVTWTSIHEVQPGFHPYRGPNLPTTCSTLTWHHSPSSSDWVAACLHWNTSIMEGVAVFSLEQTLILNSDLPKPPSLTCECLTHLPNVLHSIVSYQGTQPLANAVQQQTYAHGNILSPHLP